MKIISNLRVDFPDLANDRKQPIIPTKKPIIEKSSINCQALKESITPRPRPAWPEASEKVPYSARRTCVKIPSMLVESPQVHLAFEKYADRGR